MEKAKQRTIAEDLCNGLKKYILDRIDTIPENWDGIEIRQWVIDAAQEQIASGYLKGARLRDYRNTLLVKNL